MQEKAYQCNKLETSIMLFLTLTFVILKCCGIMTASWWLVLLPLYIVPAFILAFFLLSILFGGICILIAAIIAMVTA